MMKEGQDNRIKDKPSESHYSEAGFWFIVKTIALNSYRNKYNSYESHYGTGDSIQAECVVKNIDSNTSKKGQKKEECIRYSEWEQQNKQYIEIGYA